jgi:chloramphenicol 3-O phosphotransferase
VATQVIVLNGGSSAGKSGIARCLQTVLPDPWLALGTDTLVQAMPGSSRTSAAGIEFASDGAVIVGPEFRLLEAAWISGIVAMAGAGARIIVDEVFLGGAASQQRWKTALGPLPVLTAAVEFEPEVQGGDPDPEEHQQPGSEQFRRESAHHGVKSPYVTLGR